MEPQRFPRKELMPLVRPQMKIVLLVCFSLILSCIVVSFLQTYFFLTSLRSRGVLPGGLAAEVVPVSCLIALVTLLVMAPVFIYIAVWVSHRILGPLRRLSRELERVGEGRVTGGFTVRAGDDLTFLGSSVTGMKEGLAFRVRACRDAARPLEQAVQRVEVAASAGAMSEIGPGVSQLRLELARWRGELDQFQV